MRKRMKALRVLGGLTQKDLAQKIGKSQQIISLIETGNFEPRGNLRKNIAKVLKTNPEELFPGG